MKLLFILITALRVALIGDPQVDDERELDFARRTIYAELRERKDLDLIIVMGDIVNEKPLLIAPSEALLDSTRCHWIRVQGNHDGRELPADTAFVTRGVRFIMLNQYGLRQDKADVPDSLSLAILSTIRKGEKTVVCSHVPVADSIIARYGSDVLFASAHLHVVKRHVADGGAESLGVGATCGSWWRGVADKDGIPNALMNCGAPRGYFVADLNPARKVWYRLSYKCVGRKADERLSLHADGRKLVFNVYGGSSAGRLEARIGGKWVEVPFHPVVAPEVQQVIDFNKSVLGDRAYRKAHKEIYIPMRTVKSPHTWCISLDEGTLPAAGSTLCVRYRDNAMQFKCRAKVEENVILVQ